MPSIKSETMASPSSGAAAPVWAARVNEPDSEPKETMREGKNLIGVDIGSSSIKVCQLRETRKAYTLVNFGYAPLPPQAIVDGQVMDGNMVADTLQHI